MWARSIVQSRDGGLPARKQKKENCPMMDGWGEEYKARSIFHSTKQNCMSLQQDSHLLQTYGQWVKVTSHIQHKFRQTTLCYASFLQESLLLRLWKAAVFNKPESLQNRLSAQRSTAKLRHGQRSGCQGRKQRGFSGPATPLTGREEPQLFLIEEELRHSLVWVATKPYQSQAG